MKRKMSSQRRQIHRDLSTYGVRVETAPRAICEYAGKAIYTSEHDAKQSRRGHAKDMRPYQCPEHPSHFHLTKDWKVKW